MTSRKTGSELQAFIRQRYEDTSLVIFREQSKERSQKKHLNASNAWEARPEDGQPGEPGPSGVGGTGGNGGRDQESSSENSKHTPKNLRIRGNLPTSLSTHRDDYEQKKKHREERFQKLQNERQQILHERERLLSKIKQDGLEIPPSRSSDRSLNAVVNSARKKIPRYEAKVRNQKELNERRKQKFSKPYRGEFGIGSYEPWQLEDFYFVRDFVRSWVDEVLEYIVYEPLEARKEALDSFTVEFQKELEIEQSEIRFAETIRGINDSVMENVIKEMLCKVADDSITIHLQSRQVVNNIILDTIMPEDADDAIGSQITGAFQQMKKERSKWPDLWRHTQKLNYIGDSTDKPEIAAEDVFDGIVLSFDGIVPYDSTPNKELSPIFKAYRNAESSYWMGFTPITSSLPLPKRYKGVSCTALSSDNSLLAVGTEQGDIAVWDLIIFPPRVLRACRGNSAMIQIQWSLDSSQMLSLSARGTVYLWSMRNTKVVSNDVKGFEPQEHNLGFKASDLTPIITLEPRELRFINGPLKALTNGTGKPTCVVFHPSCSFLGKQESIMVGMARGGILKLNLSSQANMVTFPMIAPSSGTGNKVGRGIDAELFKSHKHPIRLIEFVNDSVVMVTVDEMGYIYTWVYSEENLSGYGWFTPVNSYQLDMSKTTFHPVSSSKEKIEFEDSVQGTGRIKELNRQDMIRKRKEIQTLINSLHLGKPWKSQFLDMNKVTYIYAPRHVPVSGTTFHQVTYYVETKVLARYTTQLYKPEKIQATKLISCHLNPLRNKLVFGLLFPEIHPKEPHIVIVSVNLKPVRVDRNIIEIPLDNTEYNQCKTGECCEFDVSKVIDATGSEYMISNVCGNINGFSMSTGSTVMASSQENWVGCHLKDNEALTFTDARVMVACPVTGMVVLLYAPRQNMLTMLHLKDKNTREEREHTWEAFCNLRALNPAFRRLSGGVILNRRQKLLAESPDSHVDFAIRTLILDLIDVAIQRVEGEFSEEELEMFALQNRQAPFVNGQHER